MKGDAMEDDDLLLAHWEKKTAKHFGKIAERCVDDFELLTLVRQYANGMLVIHKLRRRIYEKRKAPASCE